MKLRKQAARLRARQQSEEQRLTRKDAPTSGFHKPGSMNPHKSFPYRKGQK